MIQESIEEMGEESGREECCNDYPFQYTSATYRTLYHWGRARAQGLYGLRGKEARLFAQSWAIGYQANCAIFAEHEEEE